ncbi:hypothetical protein [Actinokineospora bangkokensis]|uniref:Uncharacterized protein n=1 Tax=Actinokineospora bangkokensis TaxID=1193682 RepID=A0A1Q9LMW1_9PSEU|nr:hypothetical protein [Actinokineospora bangkokensis]OLR93343.1 hypothetical protein BJP25_17890 [Actinokineospora bangkokensis]
MGTNITFDETKYNQLIKVMDDLEYSLLHNATTSDTVWLDDSFTLQPGKQHWQPAVDLVTKGQKFGASVAAQNETLRQAIVKFRNALVEAKSVFKDHSDLANYEIGKFVAEFPDFNAGGGLTGGGTGPK